MQCSRKSQVRLAWPCGHPCKKAFDSESKLAKHHRNAPQCKEKWDALQRNDRVIEFEMQTQHRRAVYRESLGGADVSLISAYDPGSEPEDRSGEINQFTSTQGEIDIAMNSNVVPSNEQPAPSTIEENLFFLHNLPFFDGPEEEFSIEDEIGKDLEEALFGAQPILAEEDNCNPLLEEYDNASDAGDYEGEPHAGQTPLDPPDPIPDQPVPDPTPVQPSRPPHPEPDEDEDEDNAEIKRYPQAGEVKATTSPRFKDLINEFLKKPGGLSHPFKNAKEFELVKWLNALPMARVDEFLQLSYVRIFISLWFTPYLQCFRPNTIMISHSGVQKPCASGLGK